MKGSPGTEPDGIAGDCFYILLMHGDGDGATVRELHQWITREHEPLGWPVPALIQVRQALSQSLSARRPPLVRRTGRYSTARWHVTDHGRRMLDVWVPDPEPVRTPCGLGWPA